MERLSVVYTIDRRSTVCFDVIHFYGPSLCYLVLSLELARDLADLAPDL